MSAHVNDYGLQLVRGRFDRPLGRGRRCYKKEEGEVVSAPREETAGGGKTDYKAYTVKEGEGISSISFRHGLFPESVWDDPKNRELKEKRPDPNVLLPGDVVYVREKELKEVSGASEQRHRFRRKGIPEILRLRFVDEDDEPRGGINYVVEVDGTLLKGTTNGDGVLEKQIPPNAKRATISLESEEGPEVMEVELGHLDPVSEITGVQGRLNNLGYLCGDEQGELGEHTRHAISRFQADHSLKVTGEPDDRTRKELEKAHKA